MTKLIQIFIIALTLSFINLTNAHAITPGPAPHFEAEENIDIKTEIFGDTFLIGQNITISKPVNGDLFIVAENVSVNAPVNGDLRVVSSKIQLTSRVIGSVGFIAERVSITPTGEVDKDAYGIAKDFVFQGRIGEDLNLGYAEDSNIIIEGNIIGNIHYLNKAPDITDKAFLGGSLVKTDISAIERSEKQERLQIIIGKIIHSLSLILIAVLAIKFFPKGFVKGFDLYTKKISKNLLYGILAILVIPLVLGVMLISIIGMPLALLTIALVIFIIYIAPIYPAVFIGQKLLPQSQSITLQVICGIFVFDVVSMGPVIGSILYTFSMLTLLGLVFKRLLALEIERKQR